MHPHVHLHMHSRWLTSCPFEACVNWHRVRKPVGFVHIHLHLDAILRCE